MDTLPNRKLPDGFIEVPPHAEKEVSDKDGGIFLILRREISGPPTILYFDCCNDKLWSSGQEQLAKELESKNGATHAAYKTIKRQNELLADYSVRIIQETSKLRVDYGPSIAV